MPGHDLLTISIDHFCVNAFTADVQDVRRSSRLATRPARNYANMHSGRSGKPVDVGSHDVNAAVKETGEKAGDLEIADNQGSDSLLVRFDSVSLDVLNRISVSQNKAVERQSWLNNESFKLCMFDKVSLMCKVFSEGKRKGDYIIIPKDDVKLKLEILSLCHYHPLAGHFGENKTIQRIFDSGFYWVNMKKETKEFIKNCLICTSVKDKRERVAHSNMMVFPAVNPFDVVHVDFVGPFEISSQENKYVLVLIDRFTRYIACVPTASTDLTPVKFAIESRICCVHGVPNQVTADNGPPFNSAELDVWLSAIGSKLHLVTPYTPQANGAVERANKVVVDLIRSMLAQFKGVEWDTVLPFVEFQYNTHVNRVTGYSPYQLVFGRLPRMGVRCKFNNLVNENSLVSINKLLESVPKFLSETELLRNNAVVNQNVSYERTLMDHSVKNKAVVISIGKLGLFLD
eukprot:TRINITY_DN7672_c0_g1_i1.p1 TRINITY_DN7672_c0_g1~~TRINITY_DN7672_c0_g1_i1.p1  ORF type:complete len:458 (-),score=71.42 TRINITY_DN7672_c0_g1_i1:1042-2415(-)